MELEYGGRESEIKKLARCYKTIADASLCYFIDSNEVISVSGTDGLHPLPADYKILGEYISNKVKDMKI